jgi:hypothetical protein
MNINYLLKITNSIILIIKDVKYFTVRFRTLLLGMVLYTIIEY